MGTEFDFGRDAARQRERAAEDIDAWVPSARLRLPIGYLQYHRVPPYDVDRPLQRRVSGQEQGQEDHADPRAIAAAGLTGGGALPHREQIQASFGRHDVQGIRASVGGPAAEASQALRAEAYTLDGAVAFREAPSLHTAAHEAAHAVLQRRGVGPAGGVGQDGDAHEHHADAVADRVVRGESAEELLDQAAGAGGGGVQRRAAAHNPLGDAMASRYVHALQRKPALQLRSANGVSVSAMRFSPREIKDDGATTSQASAQYSARMGGGAKLDWTIEGDALGSTISAEGLITPGTDTVPFKQKDKATLKIKATDSKEKGAYTDGTLTLWSQTYLKAKEDYPKFAGGSYKAAAKVGKFDVTYAPNSHRLAAEMKLEFKFFDDNPFDPKDKWTTKRKAAYKQTFIQQARAAWNAKFTFSNVREPKSVWSKLNPVRVDLKITPVAAGGHYVVEAHRHPDKAHASDKDQWASRAALHNGDTLKVMQGNEKRNKDFRSAETAGGEQASIDRILPGPIAFAKDSADVPADPKLDFFATYLRRIHHPKVLVSLVGHADPAEKQPGPLSQRRAQGVAAKLRQNGLNNHPIGATGQGDKAPATQTVVVAAKVDPNFKKNKFDVLPHEFGHMLGLGDEYPYAVGDKAHPSDHHGLVADALGKDYADQVAMQADNPSANIMHYGNDVRIQDYVTFWAALGDAAATAAAPTPAFKREDWKING